TREVPEMESVLKENQKDSNATYSPEAGQLDYTWVSNSADSRDYVLAYKYKIACYSHVMTSYEVYVNAHTGVWIKNNSLTRDCGQVATANLLYYGTQTFLTHYRGFPSLNYVLRECNHPVADLETKWQFKKPGSFGTLHI